SPVHHPPCRPDRRRGRGADRGAGHARGASGARRPLRPPARDPVRPAGGDPRGEEAMSTTAPLEPGRWADGELPANVLVGPNSLLTGARAFERFRSRLATALTIGAHCTMDGVHFALGEEGRMEVGDYCYFTNAVLLCELEVRIGSYV